MRSECGPLRAEFDFGGGELFQLCGSLVARVDGWDWKLPDTPMQYLCCQT